MGKKKALVFYGGWEGHEPEVFGKAFQKSLLEAGFAVTLSNALEVLDDQPSLFEFDVIVPFWTIGTLSEEQSNNLQEVVKAGTGLAGIHGGMGDAFRGNLDYEWMVGGHYVGHPFIDDYEVRVTQPDHETVSGLNPSFIYNSEQYYMLMDPGVNVLAETIYFYEDKPVTMPVIWTKEWGKGRVFYSALGHTWKEMIDHPAVWEMSIKGIQWASR
ncbi:MAG: ThuA domain-containing protein [Verrucomicrobia bacterium]|nr:ThuA domain-containing protein [Verrucomicrobiota bacterium]